MSKGMNNFISLKGLVGQPARQFEGDKGKFTVISIAQNYQTKDGNKKTSWYEAVAFGKVSEKLLFIEKGDLIHLLGHIQPQTKNIEGKDYTFNRIIIQSAQKIAKMETLSHSDIPQFHEGEEVPF